MAFVYFGVLQGAVNQTLSDIEYVVVHIFGIFAQSFCFVEQFITQINVSFYNGVILTKGLVSRFKFGLIHVESWLFVFKEWLLILKNNRRHKSPYLARVVLGMGILCLVRPPRIELGFIA